MIPGYFERLRVRIDSFPLLKQQALQGSLEINRAIDEYKLGVQKAITDLTVASKASIDQLLGMREELDREMQAAVEEVERTLAEDQPHTYSRYAPLLRRFAESARSLELISFSVQTCPIPPQDWVVLHLQQIHEQSERVQIEFESVMLTNEAKLKQAQLPAFQYSRSVPVWELVEPIKLSDGSVYIGELRSGKRCGPGKLLIWEGGLMEGYWANDFLHGKGRYIYPIGDMYAGDYFEGEKQGFGRVEDLSGVNSYEGEWLHDKKHGKGIEHIEDGSVYEGQFENNTKSGLGVFKWASGEVYKGEFLNDLLQGRGKYVWKAETKWYDGEWVEGKMHGKGKFVNEGKEYEGDFVADKKQGKGVYRWEGHVYEGDFFDNKMHGQGYLTMKGKERRLYTFESNKRLHLL